MICRSIEIIYRSIFETLEKNGRNLFDSVIFLVSRTNLKNSSFASKFEGCLKIFTRTSVSCTALIVS